MKKNTFGFTLVEMLVVLAIIGILVIGASNINFNPQIDNQNSMMFTNNIFTSIESIRNSALLGKGVGSGILIHPEKWVINISTRYDGTNSGTISAKYSTGGGIFSKYDDFFVNFINSQSQIKELKCLNVDKINSHTGSDIDLEFFGNNLSLSGCNSPNNKILEIKTKYKKFEKIIRINTVSGVMEKL